MKALTLGQMRVLYEAGESHLREAPLSNEDRETLSTAVAKLSDGIRWKVLSKEKQDGHEGTHTQQQRPVHQVRGHHSR